MGKLTLKIPSTLDECIDGFLTSNSLEIRDKSRIILFAIEKMIISGEVPAEFKTRCQNAKEQIREKQRNRAKVAKDYMEGKQ